MGLFSKKKTQTEKQELRYLNRKDVLELLREQTRRSAALEKEVEELKAQVKEREAALQNAAALVEEALCISEVFEKAISDSRRHVTNIQRMNMEQFTDNELEQHEDREDTAQVVCASGTGLFDVSYVGKRTDRFGVPKKRAATG